MKFYLGVHRSHWLRLVGVPLFISHRVLAPRRALPRALGGWALDSGGFTELAMHGAWRTTVGEYADAVARYATEIGNLEWASPQDWMCEPHMIERTGLSVREHQERTVENYLELHATGLPFIPVLQGWKLEDYATCVELYAAAGVRLHNHPVVGLGSVCRRQHTEEIGQLVRDLSADGIRLHGFGVKLAGLRAYSEHLTSADSMAWSFRARRSPPLPGHTHKNCANCLEYALAWRERIVAA